MLAMLASLALSVLPPADVIYTDGDILTMVEGQPAPEALAVRNGRIAAVGTRAEVMKLRGPATKVVELGKRALLPGFVDPHSHFLAAVVVADWANVSLPPVGPVRSIPDILAVLAKQAARQKAKPGDWIVGYGYDSIGLAEKRDVNRRDLDAAFPGNPVMLLHVSDARGGLRLEGPGAPGGRPGNAHSAGRDHRPRAGDE